MKIPTSPSNRHNNSASAPRLLVAMLIGSVLAMAALFGYTAIGSNNNNQFRALAGDLRVITLQMVNHSNQAVHSQTESFARLAATRDGFQEIIDQLRDGNPKSGLPSGASIAQAQFDKVSVAFDNYKQNIDIILRSEGVIRLLTEFVSALNKVMPEILDISESVNKAMISSDIRIDIKHLASRQLLLGQRIATDANRLMIGGKDSAKIAQDFRRDTDEFNRILHGLLDGDIKSGIPAVSHRRTREHLYEILPLFETVRELASRILEKSPELVRAHTAAHNIFMLAEPMMLDADDLMNAYVQRDSLFSFTRSLAFVLGVVVVILLGFLNTSVNRVTRAQLETEQAKNRRQQDAIMQLLDEISPVANGDLTAKATVSREITGAIADAINYAIEALRNLVIGIEKMSARVANTAEETQATALHLARASEQQAKQVAEVGKTVSLMARGTQNLSERAKESSKMAKQASAIAEQGVVAVNNSIHSMQTLQEDIRNTSIRIKRLGESSQAIGDIAEIIDDIAEQTQILALNAAIQAAAAGAQGLGFATVAEEVQQLAERVNTATRKIESLITSIQVDTGEAITSMEQSTADSLEGAHLAEIAGVALRKMVSVSIQLNEFIQQVAGAAQELTQTAEQMAINMEVINRVTSQNLAGTRQTAHLTGELAKLADEQRGTVAKFKLPPAWDEQA